MISFRRMYHVTGVAFSLKKQGIKLCKMVNPLSKKRSWYPAQTLNDVLPSVKSLTKTKNEPGKRGMRRTAMLNKVFMKQITDLMSTGTVSMNIVGRGIEISKVNVTPDFKTVNVYWVCKGKASDKETGELLNKTAGILRHELSTLRIMGEIPYIVFVKDHQEANVAELDRRLAIADYGEDYVMTEEGHLLKSEFVLSTQLSPEVKAKIKQLENKLPIVEDPIPEMTHNVYGLNHDKIMNRLLAARKKSKDAWTSLDTHNEVVSYRVPSDITPKPAVCNQSKELADFLLQRQLLHKKMAKYMKQSDDLHLQSVTQDESDFNPEDYNPEEYYYEDLDEIEDDEEEFYGFDEEIELEDFETPSPDINDKVNE